MALAFREAREMVLNQVGARRTAPQVETVSLEEACGRILAEHAPADREYPPFDRSARDGYAVRSADLPGRFRVIGEVRAGEIFESTLREGQAVEIMTGAPVPRGADAVVMVEHAIRMELDLMSTDRTLEPGANIARAGSEAHREESPLQKGSRIDYAGIGWLATTGHDPVLVYARPKVAIIATGDEIVGVNDKPELQQIRNSNSYSLSAQVKRAGGIPVILPVARDNLQNTRELVGRGLEADLLLISGGVSAGKYDVVEQALGELGAEFYFDRVLIQPGQPVVFGRAHDKFFFGLPGNPASTMVTFEIFARSALELIAGLENPSLPLSLARLREPFRHKTGLTRFLPANVICAEVTPVPWQGSGDVPAFCRANGFMVADKDQAEYDAGELIPVMLRQ